MTGMGTETLTRMGNMVILVGLAFASLMAGSSFGMAGASAAKGMVESGFKTARGAATGYTKRRVRQGAATALNSDRARRLETGLQENKFATRTQARLSKVLGSEERGAAASKYWASASGVQAAGRYIGRGLEAARVKSEGVVEDEKKNLPSGPNSQLANVINTNTATEPQAIAILEKLVKDGDLGYIKELDKLITADREAIFNRYGKQKLWKDLQIARQSTPEMRSAAKSIVALRNNQEPEAVVDTEGILGTQGAIVSLEKLKGEVPKRTAELRESAKKKQAQGNTGDAAFDEAAAKRYEDALSRILAKPKDEKIQELDTASKKLSAEFHAGLQKKDVSTMHVNENFSDKPQFGMSTNEMRQLGDIISYGISNKAPQLISPIVAKLKSTQLEIFEKTHRDSLIAQRQAATSQAEQDNIDKRLKELDDSIKNNILFDSSPASTQTAPPPPPTP
jgi:hypothetical protein